MGLIFLLSLEIVNCDVNVLSCLIQEKEAVDIEIPNISWKVFELMMR